MAHVRFTLDHTFDAPPGPVWDELVDWKGHEAWIPATTVELGPGEPGTIGSEFTATSGYGPLALVDRMRVDVLEFDRAMGSGQCRVTKLGPILTGFAEFTITRNNRGGADMAWIEDVQVPYAPQFLAPVLSRAGVIGFRLGFKKLAKLLAERGVTVS